MIVLGTALAAVAAAGIVLSFRPVSAVRRVLDLIGPPAGRPALRWSGVTDRDVRHAGIALDAAEVTAVKVAGAVVLALVASGTSLVLPLGPAVVLLAGYAGFVLPSLVISHRASSRRAEAERALTILVERIEALVAAGRPPETAVALLLSRPSGSALLDAILGRVLSAYMLGAPIFRTLAALARDDGIPALAAMAEELERARDLGAGSIGLIRQRRLAQRAAERARILDAASQVEGKLMLVLVLCYLPALLLLVVIPLFVGLLEGLFV